MSESQNFQQLVSSYDIYTAAYGNVLFQIHENEQIVESYSLMSDAGIEYEIVLGTRFRDSHVFATLFWIRPGSSIRGKPRF